MKPLVFAALALVTLAACGGSTPQPVPAAAPVSSARTPAPAPEPPPSSSLARGDVVRVVRAGLGSFLQRVDLDVDHPVMDKQGKFHGYRIVALKGDPTFWRGVDLIPGDVVTRVNGFGVGDPNEAHEAFSSLETASELRVEYERDGQPHELRYAIVDQ